MRNLSVIKGLYQGNGVTRRFAIPFEYNDKAQIFVTITTYDEGDYTYRVLDSTEYTIDEDSVEIVYPKTDDDEPIPSTQYLTVWRDTDLLQLMDLTNQGAAWPDSIEASLDKLHQIVQELAEGLSRSLKVDIGDPQTPDEKLVAIQDYVLAAAESSRSASASESSAQRAAEAAAISEANAAESERLAGGYADTATAAAGRAEDSAISARAYNAPDYDNETTYQAGDVITYTDGNSYRALQETTGNEPPNIIYWQKVTDYVGDDFFEVDEYGYIVPMDSPSHSRYWRVDQNGYIVPIEGGDGGYRPDTRQLSAEYLNVTNEGYVKHLRADDVNAGNLSATGNVTAGMVTTPQANVTTLTANAVNAGTVTANDIIAKGPIVDVRAFGAKGDGVTDDTAAIQAAIDSGKCIYLPLGNYKVTDINIKSNTNIIGTNATIDGNVNITGTIGNTVTASDITETTITSNELNKDDVLYIYKYGYNREVNKVTNVNSGVADLKYTLYHCNDNTFEVKKINSINNVKISGINLIGDLTIKYANEVTLTDLSVAGIILCASSIDVAFLGKTSLQLGNEQRADFCSGSRGCYIEDIDISGGNTVSDNGALKLNEVFDSTVNKVKVGPALPTLGGYFHAIMLDGAFTEEGYPNNPSVNISLREIEISDTNFYHSIFISLCEYVYIDKVKCKRICAKSSKHIYVKTGEMDYFMQETLLEDVVLDSLIIKTSLELQKDTTINNCKIESVKVIVGNACDCTITNCVINQLTRTSGTPNAATNYKFIGCEFTSMIDFTGFTNSILSACMVKGFVYMNVCNNCYLNAIATYDGNNSTVLFVQSSTNIEGFLMGNGGFSSGKFDNGGNTNVNISVVYA